MLSITQQSLHFREEEVSQIFSLIQAGESASIIGVSGIGKSNFFNHLLDPFVQAHYLGDKANSYILVRINVHYLLDFSIRSVFSLVLDQIMLLEENAKQLGIDVQVFEQIGEYHNELIAAKDDLLKVQHYFTLALRILMRRSERCLIFLFDQFEELFESDEARLFTILRDLRETYKYRFVYITFTRNTLSSLAASDLIREEFYELLAANVLGLKPYNRRDAKSMIDRIVHRIQLTLTEELAETLFSLSGGHAGLLRAVLFDSMGKLPAPGVDSQVLATKLLQHTNVTAECTKILASLSVEEQQVITSLAHSTGTYAQDEESHIRLLQSKGILTFGSTPGIFSQLFRSFVQNHGKMWENPLYFDKVSRRVWVLGKPTPSLTILDFRLFQCLYDNLDQGVEKDKLIDAGWPGAKGGVSPEALASAIYRLRKKIEPDPDNPRFIQSERDFGYQLIAN